MRCGWRQMKLMMMMMIPSSTMLTGKKLKPHRLIMVFSQDGFVRVECHVRQNKLPRSWNDELLDWVCFRYHELRCVWCDGFLISGSLGCKKSLINLYWRLAPCFKFVTTWSIRIEFESRLMAFATRDKVRTKITSNRKPLLPNSPADWLTVNVSYLYMPPEWAVTTYAQMKVTLQAGIFRTSSHRDWHFCPRTRILRPRWIMDYHTNTHT